MSSISKLHAPQAGKRVLSVLNIVVFSIIVLAMAVFLIVLLYQWLTHPTGYTSIKQAQDVLASLV